MESRYEILLETYSKVINIEGLTMVDMAKKQILPAVNSYIGNLASTGKEEAVGYRRFILQDGKRSA